MRCVLERNEQDREEYMALIAAHYRPEQLVFADESHFNRLTLRRPYAWALRGERATKYEFFLCGNKYSILPALSLDGILHLEVVENAVTGDIFRQFIEGLLPCMNKWPLPHSVLVVDNAAIHKVAGIRELVEGHGMCLLYLPAYSPDFNPIELTFSSIKAWLRANRARINAELDTDEGSVYHAIWEAVYSVTMDDAKGWYSHSGYYQVPP
jgi:transposase